MQNNTYNKKVLLYSGGMDSWLIDKLWKPDIRLYIDMNTRYSKEEMKRLPDDIVIEKLDLSKWEREDKIIPLRNMYLMVSQRIMATKSVWEQQPVTGFLINHLYLPNCTRSYSDISIRNNIGLRNERSG